VKSVLLICLSPHKSRPAPALVGFSKESDRGWRYKNSPWATPRAEGQRHARESTYPVGRSLYDG